MTVMRAKAIGCGHYLPARVVTNNELAARIDTTDEWIRTRTGIERRHVAADGEKTSDLAIAAARSALATSGGLRRDWRALGVAAVGGRRAGVDPARCQRVPRHGEGEKVRRNGIAPRQPRGALLQYESRACGHDEGQQRHGDQ